MFCTPTFGSGPIRINNKILNLTYATDILSHIKCLPGWKYPIEVAENLARTK